MKARIIKDYDPKNHGITEEFLIESNDWDLLELNYSLDTSKLSEWYSQVNEKFSHMRFNFNTYSEKLDENVTVRFNTNGTLYNDKIFKELKRFKHVNISFSVDGIGKVNDYIRWGSTWKEIEYNINKYQELSGFFSVSSVVQILNILYIDELKEWVKSLNLEHYETFLLNPKHYCLYNAVDDIKNTVKGYDHIRNIEADVSEQNKFVEYTNILDNNRNCKIRDYLPEVAKLYGIN